MHNSRKKSTTSKILKLFIFSFLVGTVYMAGTLYAAPASDQSSQELGIEACADCHDEIAKAFTAMPHAEGGSCTACHGDAEAHLEEGGGPNIFAFKDTDLANAKSKMCLECHSKTNPRYMASPHAKAAMDCTVCHSVHSKSGNHAMLAMEEPKGCTVCHEDITAQFQLNERHRLQEGTLSCSSCHNPHEPSARASLGGFKHEACISCHTDKGGPFLYEHDASRIEGCGACHEVHGTPNRRMLTHQSISDLCFSCHAAAPSFHARFDSYTSNCTTCHPTIHGSHLSKIFLK